MFYNLIYFNENLYDTYYAFASAGQAVEFKEIESQTDKGAQLGFDSTQIGLGKSSVIKGEIISNAPSKLISLERSLVHNDYFVDFEAGDAFREIEDLSRRMIFRATLPLKIHEAFDMYEVTRLMKSKLLDAGLMGSTSDDADLFNMVFDFDKVKLPVYNNDMDTLIFSKLHRDCLLIEENEFDELEEDNIVLAKVKKTYDGAVTLFDPLKDFMNLDSNTRKIMESDIGGHKQLQPIYHDTNAIEVEIIAIYT
ncbi:hypothetical protein J4760_12005 [Salinicoccus sp. ID82-1]|uniref:hypothetical protein n=1 Tax=Salinicoccus sp. ID82-1 TaxID=2820269 RepID=UPI001F1E2409|nr:hypothetical protein [Salinicoccus sp. ID82-1]MCG1010743.1 hypothetical protein [Salinicoccus sp. ID82-1]